MFYTSYFAVAKKIDPSKFELISISRFPPRGFKGFCFKELAPTAEILSEWKTNPNEEKYTRDFTNLVLDNLNVADVVKKLRLMAGPKDIVLLCYEKPSDFCHRHLVADWLAKNGYPTQEMEVK